MKAIMVMFDSLNKRMLPPYGCDWVKAPNFEKLAKKTVTFNNCYAGSMPCMPARRELHTGRYNFLHRSWGPLEPFDNSMIDILKQNKIYTHLVSDHFHYWEDGGSTYHSRYNSWEIVRGQQVDPYKGEVKKVDIPDTLNNYEDYNRRHDLIDRKYCAQEESSFPQAVTFQKGIEFLEKNKDEDNWFLQIETFDPHEPFLSPKSYKSLYPHEYDGVNFDWPTYGRVQVSDSEVEHIRMEYASLVTMCDNYLGKVIDFMDKENMWEDTMLIVNTDHGFFLGEKDWFGKTIQPYYNEVINIPFFLWDPRLKKKAMKSNQLIQTIDIAPTLLDFFAVNIPKTMQGKSLYETVKNDTSIREAALFGVHGGHVSVTDGRFTYMRGPKSIDNKPLYEYTLMPTHMTGFFGKDELKTMEITNQFEFTEGIPVLKIEAIRFNSVNSYPFGTLLFDLEADPKQEKPINNKDIEEKMKKILVKLMKSNESPEEQFIRLGLEKEKKSN